MALNPEWASGLSEAFDQLHFLRPAWLIAVPLLLVLALWLARRRARAGSWLTLVDAPLLAALRLDEPTTVSRASPWPWLALAWVLAALALAGPTWQREPSPAFRAPDGWVLVLDLSPSMRAQDLVPNRVTRARYAIGDVLRAAQGARVGLVVFSDDAYAVTPLTDDMATVSGLVGPLVPEIMPSVGDRLAPALAMAQQLLERTLPSGGHVVVLSDGFEDPTAALAATERLRVRQTTLNVVAIGTASGAPVPRTDGGFEQDARGRIRMAALDGDALQRLASAGGGRVYAPGELAALTASLQAQRSGSSAPPTPAAQLARWNDAGAWLVAPLLLLVALLARRGWW